MTCPVSWDGVTVTVATSMSPAYLTASCLPNRLRSIGTSGLQWFWWKLLCKHLIIYTPMIFTCAVDPTESCLFAAGSPTDTVCSQIFLTFSTRQIAFLLAERPMPAMSRTTFCFSVPAISKLTTLTVESLWTAPTKTANHHILAIDEAS